MATQSAICRMLFISCTVLAVRRAWPRAGNSIAISPAQTTTVPSSTPPTISATSFHVAIPRFGGIVSTCCSGVVSGVVSVMGVAPF